MNDNLISTVMAVWNGEKYLREAIDSILNQSHPPSELIVVDDGSDDDTDSILRSYRNVIKHVTRCHEGQAAALRAGAEIASGQYLAFQDADDLWTFDKLAVQLKFLSDFSDFEAAFSLSEQFVSPELGIENNAFIFGQTILVGEIAACMLIRRAAFERVGNFDPTLKSAGFVEWLGRAKKLNLRFAIIDRPLHMRRLHPLNFGRTHSETRDKSLLTALKKNIDRRKTTGV